MAGEVVFPALPPVVGGGRILPTPSQFFLTGEDSIRIVSVNALAGVSLKLQARIADPKGATLPMSWDHTPNSNRTVKSADFTLGVGSLLNVTVFANAGSPRIGQTYVMVQLVRGVGAAAIVLGTLLAGYVSQTQALGFPGSPIQNTLDVGGYYRGISGATPAAGAEVLETCPTGARWELVSVQLQLVCSATVATRVLNLRWRTATLFVSSSAAVVTLTAGLTATFNWTQGLTLSAPIQAGINVSGLCLQPIMLAGDSWATQTTGLQVGDQYGSISYTVREWLEVL